MFINGEELKQIPDYPKYYAVKSGEVYRRFNKHFRKVEGTRKSNGRIRTLYIKNAKNESKTEIKARLIYKTFIGEIPEGYIVGYRNGYRNDTSVDNLFLTTFKELNKKSNRRKAVVKICPRTGDILDAYSSVTEAAKRNRMKLSTLQYYPSKKRKSHLAPDGYIYKYDSDFTY